MEAVAGGGVCNQNDILSGSFPIYNNNAEGWKIDCEQAYGSYGRKQDNCQVFAVCLDISQRQQQSYGGY